jgi:hypothetical protein
MVASFVGQLMVLRQLRGHRIDGGVPGYAAAFRTLVPSNYDSAGRRIVPWLWVMILMWLLCLNSVILLSSYPSDAELQSVRSGLPH